MRSSQYGYHPPSFTPFRVPFTSLHNDTTSIIPLSHFPHDVFTTPHLPRSLRSLPLQLHDDDACIMRVELCRQVFTLHQRSDCRFEFGNVRRRVIPFSHDHSQFIQPLIPRVLNSITQNSSALQELHKSFKKGRKRTTYINRFLREFNRFLYVQPM